MSESLIPIFQHQFLNFLCQLPTAQDIHKKSELNKLWGYLLHFRETVALMGAHTLGHTNEQVRSNNKNKYSMRDVNVNKESCL